MKITGVQRVKIYGEFKNISEFYRKYPASSITHIDGVKADYICESCEKALTAGDKAF